MGFGGRVVRLVACGKRRGCFTHAHAGCGAFLATGEQQRGKQVHLDHLGRGVQGESRDPSAFWIASRDRVGPGRRGVAAHHPRRRDSGAPPRLRPSASHPLAPLLPAHLAHTLPSSCALYSRRGGGGQAKGYRATRVRAPRPEKMPNNGCRLQRGEVEAPWAHDVCQRSVSSYLRAPLGEHCLCVHHRPRLVVVRSDRCAVVRRVRFLCCDQGHVG